MPGILHAQRPRQVHLSGSLAYSSSSSFMNLLSAGKEQLPTTHLPTKCCIRLEGYWKDTPPVFGLRVRGDGSSLGKVNTAVYINIWTLKYMTGLIAT